MLLEELRFPAARLKLVLADAGYSGPEFAHWVEKRHGVEVEIVSKTARAGFDVAPRRWVVERTFSWWNEPLVGGTSGDA